MLEIFIDHCTCVLLHHYQTQIFLLLLHKRLQFNAFTLFDLLRFIFNQHSNSCVRTCHNYNTTATIEFLRYWFILFIFHVRMSMLTGLLCYFNY